MAWKRLIPAIASIAIPEFERCSTTRSTAQRTVLGGRGAAIAFFGGDRPAVRCAHAPEVNLLAACRRDPPF